MELCRNLRGAARGWSAPRKIINVGRRVAKKSTRADAASRARRDISRIVKKSSEKKGLNELN